MKNYYKSSLSLFTAILFTAFGFAQDYLEGVFILNEGMIGTNTASVSFLNQSGTLENNIFSNQNNGMELGDTGQGMGLTQDFAYVVLNYSNEVKVINRNTFELVTSITDQLVNPRNIAFYGDKGYVTNWGDGGDVNDDYIAIIDLATSTITGTIPVAEGPERILQKDGVLYVAHQGGYGHGNTISVIDLATNSVEVITVADVPSSLKIDDNNLYVLCSGKPDWTGDETIAKLYKIDLTDFNNAEEFTFEAGQHPGFLGLDETNLYYLLGTSIYKMALDDTSLPTTTYIEAGANGAQLAYGFDKIDDKLYLADGVDYVSAGKVFVYSEDGNFISEHMVGHLPNGFYKWEDETANIEEVSHTSVLVYPNPTSGSFRLNTSENAEITIYDFLGRHIKTVTYNNQAISTAELNAGVYLFQIEMKGKTTTQKLVVK
ncbi:DUF5074 domain-containing protein [Aequorivita capsosiphonis]|uniref:DUF5074 domain-containing protein n=1 Tax=Aequorivita capsosiphonis TaxID=487317 RepID=UPI00040A4648|nr:DUF5074 domain-containing protein [Aequorivita capsosiphonis]